MDRKIRFGGRGGGKTLRTRKALLKQWPKGTIAVFSKEGIRISEEANVEEISKINKLWK